MGYDERQARREHRDGGRFLCRRDRGCMQQKEEKRTDRPEDAIRLDGTNVHYWAKLHNLSGILFLGSRLIEQRFLNLNHKPTNKRTAFHFQLKQEESRHTTDGQRISNFKAKNARWQLASSTS